MMNDVCSSCEKNEVQGFRVSFSGQHGRRYPTFRSSKVIET